jgi:glycosyltransferase involved in cell wall biosynthesis
MTGPSLNAKGGIAASVRALTTSLRRQNEDVRVAYVATSGALPTSLPVSLWVAVVAYAGFWRALREGRAIAHINTSWGRDFWRNAPLLALARLLRRQTILHVHVPWAFQAFMTGGPRPLSSLKRRLARLADVIVVPCESGVATLSELAGSRPLRIVPNGVAPADFRSPPLVGRARLVTFLGWLVPAKGVYDLLQAVATLQRQGVDVELAAFGPYGATQVSKAARDLGILEHSVIGEWVEGEAKRDLLARSRVLVLPSYSEGFPVVLLEALQSGTPIVATDVGGIPEIVRHGWNGLLVEPGAPDALADSLEKLLTDDGLWESMHANCLRDAPRYHVDRVADRLSRLYRELSGGADLMAAHE